MLAFGTRYLFRAAIAILRLIQNDLLGLDMTEVNEYFKSFKTDSGFESNGANNIGGINHNPLPPIEAIIAESLKVKIDDHWLD